MTRHELELRVIIPVLLGLLFVGLGGLFIWLRLLFWYHG